MSSFAIDQRLFEKRGTASSKSKPGASQPRLPIDREMIHRLLAAEERLGGRIHAILGRDGAILEMSDEGLRALADCGCYPIGLIGKTWMLKSHSSRFAEMLRVEVGQSETFVEPCDAVGGHCILRVTGLDSDSVLAVLHRAHDSSAFKFASLEEAFGLTPSEAKVIEQLLNGKSPAQVSEETTTSVHTVRAHIRHSYDKLGVSSREELWQKIAAYRLD